ncbi:hypothetical protein ACLBXX_02855 [Microbacterium sp. C23T]
MPQEDTPDRPESSGITESPDQPRGERSRESDELRYAATISDQPFSSWIRMLRKETKQIADAEGEGESGSPYSVSHFSVHWPDGIVGVTGERENAALQAQMEHEQERLQVEQTFLEMMTARAERAAEQARARNSRILNVGMVMVSAILTVFGAVLLLSLTGISLPVDIVVVITAGMGLIGAAAILLTGIRGGRGLDESIYKMRHQMASFEADRSMHAEYDSLAEVARARQLDSGGS